MIELKQLSISLGIEEYEMLQGIENNENGFMNTVKGISFEKYKQWLIDEHNHHLGKNLPKDWIPYTTYFLYVNNSPVGIGRIRHSTNDYLQKVIGAGEIGYGISNKYRRNGYGNILFEKLLQQCHNIGYKEITLYPHKTNIATIKIMLKNGGKIIGDFNEEKFIITIPTKK